MPDQKQHAARVDDPDLVVPETMQSETIDTGKFSGNVESFRLIESKEPDTLVIDVHVISPGWGSSGYYSEEILRKACDDGVYCAGTHMHIDHPTQSSMAESPARTINGDSPLAAIFTESGHYDPNGWDGPGVYTKARVIPEYVVKIKALAGNIGISHYVSADRKHGTAEGKKGWMVTKLIPNVLNTVDFVTVPGASGHYRTLGEAFDAHNEEQITEQNMTDKITIAEVMKSPEIMEELKEHFAKESESAKVIKEQANRLTEAIAETETLKEQVKALKFQIVESKVRDYLAEEISKAKLPEASANILTESLKSQVVLTESGDIDAAKYGEIVSKAIEAKVAEVESIRKDVGIVGNGPTQPDTKARTKLFESFRDMYLDQGYTKENAESFAERSAGGR